MCRGVGVLLSLSLGVCCVYVRARFSFVSPFLPLLGLVILPRCTSDSSQLCLISLSLSSLPCD